MSAETYHLAYREGWKDAERTVAERIAAEVSTALLHQYSEWLDEKDLIVGSRWDAIPPDHDALVTEFLASGDSKGLQTSRTDQPATEETA